MNRLTPALALAALCLATPARADPCTAPVSGHHAGQVLTGTVRYVGDGDSLCIDPGRYPTSPDNWIEIRLADFYAPELHEPGGEAAKAALARYLGRPASCTVTRGQGERVTSYDRVIAICTVDGARISERLRAAGIQQGGRGR